MKKKRPPVIIRPSKNIVHKLIKCIESDYGIKKNEDLVKMLKNIFKPDLVDVSNANKLSVSAIEMISGVKVKYSFFLNYIAKSEGYQNYNSMRAIFDNGGFEPLSPGSLDNESQSFSEDEIRRKAEEMNYQAEKRYRR